jgi:hypothetical protein
MSKTEEQIVVDSLYKTYPGCSARKAEWTKLLDTIQEHLRRSGQGKTQAQRNISTKVDGLSPFPAFCAPHGMRSSKTGR